MKAQILAMASWIRHSAASMQMRRGQGSMSLSLANPKPCQGLCGTAARPEMFSEQLSIAHVIAKGHQSRGRHSTRPDTWMLEVGFHYHG